MNSSPSEDEKPNESRFVLDSSAFLALALNETGSLEVREALLAGAMMSAVNLAEVLARLLEEGGTIERSLSLVLSLNPKIVDYSVAHAQATAQLRLPTKPFGLGLGDRACLALAQEHGVPALTADRPWRNVDVGVEIRMLR